MVRGDTFWTGEIYAGEFGVVDVSNKSNPQVLATQSTPNQFTHNCWPSDDNNYLFTTDEQSDAYVTAYDVSDLSNIQEVDRYQSQHSDNTIPHNTFYHNGFLVTSYYTDGVTIVDANRPSNLVEIGHYDTAPNYSGDGFNGCWGVYPYLPSGYIIASDIQEGLYVLGPNYQRACYLEGNVTDSTNNNPISGVEVDIQSTIKATQTDLAGDYGTGVADSGYYTVTYSKPLYESVTLDSVFLDHGVVTIKDVQLGEKPLFSDSGRVIQKSNGQGISNARVAAYNKDTTFYTTTDANGYYSFTTYADTFSVVAGKWGYVTGGDLDIALTPSNNSQTIALAKGIYDDFLFDFGWTESGTATTGMWERDIPDGTSYNSQPANPGTDVTVDFEYKAYVTGNGGGSAGDDDIDDGYTLLTSPVFDLEKADWASIHYSRWFFNDGGFGILNDSLIVHLTNGSDTVVLEKITDTVTQSTWIDKGFVVGDSGVNIDLTSNMQVAFEAGDYGSGHLVEAGIDHFYIGDSATTTGLEAAENTPFRFEVAPNPFTNRIQLDYHLQHKGSETPQVKIYDRVGEVVASYQLPTHRAQLTLPAEMTPGIYFIRLEACQQVSESCKIVKIK
jgi:hypothetical protein